MNTTFYRRLKMIFHAQHRRQNHSADLSNPSEVVKQSIHAAAIAFIRQRSGYSTEGEERSFCLEMRRKVEGILERLEK
ncbi:MAG: hypothetical protein M9920_10795 [Verrucomicrobiae bacterium]|nr:hypothetical protein [Verrucomicrobiae bacterium]